MNYRHHFHAGNFADVMKHLLLMRLVGALQRKERGFLYLDTHAGRGSYDLTRALQGDTLARQPEHPDGIGRLWEVTDAPGPLLDYLAVVRGFDRERGNLEAAPRFYPGSPWIVRRLARNQDRMVLCERQPAQCEALRQEFSRERRVSVQETDGYGAPRAMLPPPEKRALVLIDPPYEAQDEMARIIATLREGLERLPDGVFAVWYPLTDRAGREELTGSLGGLQLPPTLDVELAVAGVSAGLRLRGCGLLLVNPPWRFADEVRSSLEFLAARLARAPGGAARLTWLVPER